MSEHDALVSNYQHLENLPRAADALHTLRKISSLVKPIMRKRSWHVITLKEFFPNQTNLLGLNVNRGQSICLRLRYPGDKQQFLPLEEVVDTMLHELSHNLHGPHDAKFHALWNELRDEYMDLKLKGYSGEGFLSEGHRVGGRRIPMHEMRRNARAEAEKRKALLALQKGSGNKVGGEPVRRGADIRSIIAEAVTRRVNITQGCASGTTGADQVSRDADRDGFRTKAEEDDANDRAIAQALWELVQEDEQRKAGLEPRRSQMPIDLTMEDDLNATQSAKAKNGSRTYGIAPPRPRSASPTKDASSRRTNSVSRNTSGERSSGRAISSIAGSSIPRPKSRLISEDEARRRAGSHVDLTSEGDEGSKTTSLPTRNLPPGSISPSTSTTWTCEACTLVNPINFLSCDACLSERPLSVTLSMPANVFDSVPPPSKVSTEAKASANSLGWNCNNCGSFHDHQWWTCSNCGLMKGSSA